MNGKQKSRLEKLYADISGGERFALAIRARARGDRSEYRVLVTKAKVMRATVRDPAFIAALDASEAMVAHLAVMLAHDLGMLRGLAHASSWCTAVARMWQEACFAERGSGVSPPGDPSASTLVADARTAVLGRIAERLEGFSRASELRARLPGEVLLRAWAPELHGELEALGEELASIEADPERIEGAAAGFIAAWHART